MFDFVWSEGQGGVPAGAYQGILKGIEPQPANEDQGWGEGVKFVFEVTAGDHKGKTPSRIVSGRRPSSNNNLGKMIVALMGRAPTPGDKIDPTAYIGKPYTVIVAATPKGGTRVETVIPAQ